MCKHGLTAETCSLCSPIVFPHRSAKRQPTSEEQLRRKALKEKAKAEQKAERQRKLYNMIMKCEIYMGDILGEYAIQECGEDGCEKLSSGAWVPTKAIIDDCMREAVYATYANTLSDSTREELIRMWKKHSWN